MKVAIDGGAPTVVTSPASGLMALDANSLYLYSSGAIVKIPIGGGAPTTLALAQDLSRNIAIDATSVYWIERDVLTSKVMRVPIDGGTPTILASMDGAASGIAADGTGVYGAIRGRDSPDRLMRLTPK